MRRAKKLRIAAKARTRGARYAYKIVDEADKAGVSISLALALCEQETGFRNVFGHDPTIFVGAGTVTKKKYRAYKRQRGPRGHGGMQGVGVAQLTYYAFQDQADALGGCWRIRPQLRVAFGIVRDLIDDFGEAGIWRYNGAPAYGPQVEERRRRWHDFLF